MIPHSYTCLLTRNHTFGCNLAAWAAWLSSRCCIKRKQQRRMTLSRIQLESYVCCFPSDDELQDIWPIFILFKFTYSLVFLKWLGQVFYSCPHFGSKLADMPWRMGLVFRPAPTVSRIFLLPLFTLLSYFAFLLMFFPRVLKFLILI